jgi:hypothetical protein
MASERCAKKIASIDHEGRGRKIDSMKGEDIDKLFREKLGNTVEPTSEQDWAAFEKGLDKRGGFFSPRVIGAVLLLLVGTLASAYYLGDFSEETKYSQRSASDGLETGERASNQNKNTTSTSGEFEKNSIDSKDPSSIAESVQSANDSENAQSTPFNSAGEEANDNSAISANASGTRIGSKDSRGDAKVDGNDNADGERLTGIGSNDNIPTAAAVPISSNENNGDANVDGIDNADQEHSTVAAYTAGAAKTAENTRRESDGAANNSKSEADKAMAFAPAGRSASNAKSASSNSASKAEAEDVMQMEILSLSKMESKNGQIELDLEDQEIRGVIREVPAQSLASFEPFIYIKGEQNLVLASSIGVGIGLERQFVNAENWMKNLSLSLGLGYMRSGSLRWDHQESEEVFYGFDGYQNESKLTTQRVELLQIPVHLNYSFGGVHSVFAGLESSFVINAAQELNRLPAFGDDSNVDNGYLYDADTPSYIYFMQVGYGYALNERYKIQVGGSFSNQNWNTTDEKPMGVFLKLNYHIR